MAQMGSYVPASFASLAVVDRIFTRVGAYDDLSAGQSTFMVEMTELANILDTPARTALSSWTRWAGAPAPLTVWPSLGHLRVPS